MVHIGQDPGLARCRRAFPAPRERQRNDAIDLLASVTSPPRHRRADGDRGIDALSDAHRPDVGEQDIDDDIAEQNADHPVPGCRQIETTALRPG